MEKTIHKKALKRVRVNIELFGTLNPEEYEGKSAGQLANMCEQKYREYFKQV